MARETERDVEIIHFLPADVKVKARPQETLLQMMQRKGLPVASVCGGKALCGKCKIIIEESREPLPPPTQKEVQALGKLIQKGYRLACEVIPKTYAVVRIPQVPKLGEEIILTSNTLHQFPVRLRPPIQIYDVDVPQACLDVPEGDRERLVRGLTELHGIRPRNSEYYWDPFILRKLPHVLRDYDNRVSVVIRADREIIDIRPQKRPGPFGISFDIGTTTVASYLIDLRSGEKVSVKSALNPQVAFGADVISRIAYCQDHSNGLERLQSAIVSCLNDIILSSCQEAGIDPDGILEATVVGNTVMHHLFCGVDPRYLALSPYPPVFTSRQDIKARDLGLRIAPSAYVHLLPLKAGFVGSDAMACILSTRIHRTKIPTLLVDLGTNGEIVFGNRDRLLCCSTAAGPAFEGGHIRWGMRAADGAIEAIRIDPETLEVQVVTIGHSPPKGICGSGIISAVAELIRRGIILQSGTFNPEIRHRRLRQGQDGMEFVLVWARDTSVEDDIVLTQKDVAELVMAKAAVHAGASLLIERLGVGKPQRIIMAGACGNYVDPLDAIAIDLLPGSETADLIRVGNAAGHGACLSLLNVHNRREIQKITKAVEYIELAAVPRFQELFVSAMFFTQAIDHADTF